MELRRVMAARIWLAIPTLPAPLMASRCLQGVKHASLTQSAFQTPSGSFGNFGRDVLHSEPFFNLDFSLVKNIPLGESRSVQLRFESFNTLNFQILAVPAGITIGNTNAGQVNNVTSTPRQLQIAAKITF